METPTDIPAAPTRRLIDCEAEAAGSLSATTSPSAGRRDLWEILDDGGGSGRERPLSEDSAYRYLLILQIEGRCVVKLARATARLETGDLLLLDRAVTAQRTVFGRSRQLCLALPYPPPQPHRSACCLPAIGAIRGASGMGVALRSLLYAMRGVAGTLTTREQRGLRSAVFDLALAALSAEGVLGSAEGQQQTAAVRLLAPLQQTIENSLSDPSLCPSRVAMAHGISTRHLHRLFKQAGMSFSEFVRQRRLERCRDDLADPGLRALPMTEIAFRWGFSDSSHFSRCFRAAFGCTARDFRAGRRS